MFLFTFTTIMAYSMYLSRIYFYFFGKFSDKASVKFVNFAINLATVILGFLGPLIKSTSIWNLASAMCGLISIVNLVCLLLLCKYGIATLKDYERQLEKGLDPVFIPKDSGFENADLWTKIVNENYKKQLDEYNKVFLEESK